MQPKNSVQVVEKAPSSSEEDESSEEEVQPSLCEHWGSTLALLMSCTFNLAVSSSLCLSSAILSNPRKWSRADGHFVALQSEEETKPTVKAPAAKAAAKKEESSEEVRNCGP